MDQAVFGAPVRAQPVGRAGGQRPPTPPRGPACRQRA